MLSKNLNDRLTSFLLISLLADRDHVRDLITFLPPSDQQPATQALNELNRLTGEGKKQVILDELRRLSAEGQTSSLKEIHPDWVLDVLAEESPRMISTVLRYLPGDHANYILDRLPKEILGRMPPLSQAFAADSELVQVIKKKFESLIRTESLIERKFDGTFEALPYLPRTQLEMLFRELGFREISMAFATLNEKTMQVLLRRLPTVDAEILKSFMGQKTGFFEARLKQAQHHFLSLDLDREFAENMILEAGFFIYSKAVMKEHLGSLTVLHQKFPKQWQAIMDKYIQRNLPTNTEKAVARYQKEILDVASEVKSRRKKGKISS